jgi:hypothetical protein
MRVAHSHKSYWPDKTAEPDNKLRDFIETQVNSYGCACTTATDIMDTGIMDIVVK